MAAQEVALLCLTLRGGRRVGGRVEPANARNTSAAASAYATPRRLAMPRCRYVFTSRWPKTYCGRFAASNRAASSFPSSPASTRSMCRPA
ncbi:hypothetical protein [Streptomyces sp. DH41]|uniref:hypothetical protein n=1 Tax=Streptomyces sp. DH41 TaxID=3040125 RepID=UPI00244202B2|nr:hypothetical protein [Streptomyces sp. DH41]MDG9721549.1 hypothetical protein [Streptomyces sp. DH41]